VALASVRRLFEFADRGGGEPAIEELGLFLDTLSSKGFPDWSDAVDLIGEPSRNRTWKLLIRSRGWSRQSSSTFTVPLNSNQFTPVPCGLHHEY